MGVNFDVYAMNISVNGVEYETHFDRANDYKFVIIDGRRRYFKWCRKCGEIQLYGLKTDMIIQIGKNSTCLKCRNYKGKRHPMYGKRQSDYVKSMVSKANKGRVRTKWEKETQRNRMIGSRNPNFGKHWKHSNETKRKMRIAYVKRMKALSLKGGTPSYPNYNPEACGVIDKYGKLHGYNFQHAMSGGEYYIEELGYWLDGYDKSKNVVVEYDERRHCITKRKLKDIQRQKEIIDYLKCSFYRYDEKNNTWRKIC